MESLKPRDMSGDTKEALAALGEWEEEGVAALVKAKVIVQSRHHASDWQVMNGMAALAIYRAFPRTIYLKLLSEDYRELGALAPTFQRVMGVRSKGTASKKRHNKNG